MVSILEFSFPSTDYTVENLTYRRGHKRAMHESILHLIKSMSSKATDINIESSIDTVEKSNIRRPHERSVHEIHTPPD